LARRVRRTLSGDARGRRRREAEEAPSAGTLRHDAVAYYRLGYTVTALETLRPRGSFSKPPFQLSNDALRDRRRAAKRSSPGQLARDRRGPKSSHWRASESPRSPR